MHILSDCCIISDTMRSSDKIKTTKLGDSKYHKEIPFVDILVEYFTETNSRYYDRTH